MKASRWATRTDANGEPRNDRGGLALDMEPPAVLKGTEPLPGQKELPMFKELPHNARNRRQARRAQRPLWETGL